MTLSTKIESIKMDKERQSGEWEDEFDAVFPYHLPGLGGSWPVCCIPDMGLRHVLKTFIFVKIAAAKQEGRDALLKELGMTQAWNYRDIKAIEEKARARAFEEAIAAVEILWTDFDGACQGEACRLWRKVRDTLASLKAGKTEPQEG